MNECLMSDLIRELGIMEISGARMAALQLQLFVVKINSGYSFKK
jgi:hypothetical protein